MFQERLREAESFYREHREQLHWDLVMAVEREFISSRLGPMDERVRKALLEIPRHRHVALEFYLQGLGPERALSEIYTNKIFVLNPVEAEEEIKLELASRGIKPEELSDTDYSRVQRILEPEVVATASQPFLVALMTKLVLPLAHEAEKGGPALDVGTGLGYQAAMLREAGFEPVYAVEVRPYLADHCRGVMAEEGYDGVHVICGDGSRGLAEKAPFDAIVVGAAVQSQEVTETLKQQLAIGGRLVVPEVVKQYHSIEHLIHGVRFTQRFDWQMLRLYVRRSEEEFYVSDVLSVGFVSLKEEGR